MEPPPPPPPPHGNNAQPGSKSGGLPDGKYDIFVIPPSSAGSGFLYLPSLSTQRNSFLAGVVCTSAAFFIYQTAVPVVKDWFHTTINGGGSSVFMLIIGVGVVSWAFGKTQGEGTQWTSSGSTPRPDSGTSHARSQSTGHEYTRPPPQASTSSPPPPPPPPQPEEPPPQASSPPPKSSWQRPQASAKATADAKSSWEKAREETRKREQERRNAEEIKRRKDELEKERLRQREKEARERLERELKEKREREDREKRDKEQKEKLEKLEAEKRERDAREKLIQEAKEREDKLKRELEEAKAKAAAAAATASAKKPPVPTAATEKDDDAYSFRPYDRPKRAAQTNSAGSVYSEDSYAPSATTAKTTPPPSVRGPYSTKDPDKIIIKAVYSFNNAFLRTPIAQLVSGQGHVTDGLILRITTEGLFIDDDVRGVPQREWDVKAWTLKLAEVWCPGIPITNKVPVKDKSPFLYMAASRRVISSSNPDSSTMFLDAFTSNCVSVCSEAYRERRKIDAIRPKRFPSAVTTASTDTNNFNLQSCEVNGQHVLRASIRDQEGKRYVFIIGQSEGWKVAVGLQRLRKGTQVRALGVAGMPQNEAKALLDNLGWS